ncbi:MAG: SUMF1/EgtB/PvdO family nonheme iron enzyme [Pseudomonadota bacterium]
MATFREWFLGEIDKLFGTDAEGMSHEAVCRTLGLTVSAETVRKLRTTPDYVPQKDTQEKIRQSVSQFKSHRPAPKRALKSADLEPLLRSDELASLFAPLLRSPGWTLEPGSYPCDLVKRQKHLRIGIVYRLLSRALLDPDPEQHLTSIAQAFADAYSHEKGLTLCIVTDAVVGPEVQKILNSLEIFVQPARELQRSYFDPEKVGRHLESVRRRLSTFGYFGDFPAELTDEHGDQSIDDHPMARLRRLLQSTDGPVVALVIGPYGTGKSSLLAEAALRLLKSHEEGVAQSAPIFVEASRLTWMSSIGDIFRSCRDIYGIDDVAQEAFKELIYSGALTLFIDGMDEHADLRDSRHLLSNVRNLLENMARANGRLVFSVREELFGSDSEEEEFERLIREYVAPLSNDRARVVKIKTSLFSRDSMRAFFRARLGHSRAEDQLRVIENEDALRDLASRPIFAAFLTDLPLTVGRRGDNFLVADLFQEYVTTWCRKEQDRLPEMILSATEREAWCEAAAEYLIEHDLDTNGGFSVENLDQFVALQAKSFVQRQSMDGFKKDAQIAMFLERVESSEHQGAITYKFSHRSLFEFFLAKAIVNQIEKGNGSRFKLLSAVEFKRANGVLPVFIRQMLYRRDRYATRTLEEHFDALLTWGSGGRAPRAGPGFTVAGGEFQPPPFGPGGAKNLLANLACLLSLEDNGGPQVRPLKLRGASFAGADLTPIPPMALEAYDFDGVNLEDAMLPSALKNLSVQNALRDIEGTVQRRREILKEFCLKHRIARHSRHFAAAHANRIKAFHENPSHLWDLEWVLVPGGIYKVKPDGDGASKIDVKVRVSSFLIQRYPVTNAQFLQFVKETDHWKLEETRRRDKNDYYLGGWPANPDLKLLEDESWGEIPLVYVSWYAARDFAYSQGLRLPTEIEWEIAARLFHGQTEQKYQWPGSHISSEWVQALGDGDSPSLIPEFSVFDEPPKFAEWVAKERADIPSHLIGGVREWVLDVFENQFPFPDGPIFSERDEPLPDRCNDGAKWWPEAGAWRGARESAEYRVIRGGSFQREVTEISNSTRAPQRPTNCNPDAGFRCVLPIRALRY